jgi:hypothetical protein
MANNLLNEPYGIDLLIQDIQKELYEELGLIWQGDIDGYGKVYRNPVNTGLDTPEAYATSKIITPEWFNAEKQDYESVFYDDNKSCVFCFLIDDKDDSDDEYIFNNNCKVVFMLDLDEIYGYVPQRQDSKSQVDAIRILRNISYNRYQVGGIERRIENIFREFSSKEVKFDNMDKRHVFAVNITLNYFINDKCN